MVQAPAGKVNTGDLLESGLIFLSLAFSCSSCPPSQVIIGRKWGLWYPQDTARTSPARQHPRQWNRATIHRHPERTEMRWGRASSKSASPESAVVTHSQEQGQTWRLHKVPQPQTIAQGSPWLHTRQMLFYCTKGERANAPAANRETEARR